MGLRQDRPALAKLIAAPCTFNAFPLLECEGDDASQAVTVFPKDEIDRWVGLEKSWIGVQRRIGDDLDHREADLFAGRGDAEWVQRIVGCRYEARLGDGVGPDRLIRPSGADGVGIGLLVEKGRGHLGFRGFNACSGGDMELLTHGPLELDHIGRCALDGFRGTGKGCARSKGDQ